MGRGGWLLRSCLHGETSGISPEYTHGSVLKALPLHPGVEPAPTPTSPVPLGEKRHDRGRRYDPSACTAYTYRFPAYSLRFQITDSANDQPDAPLLW
ncbi:hypothetical protein HEK131_04090 [Streptomyces seoulensis]|nr:hypothetical protein HEK131_04090 [Streptomyces seoulensis]